MVRLGLGAVLHDDPHISTVHEAGSLPAAIALLETCDIDVVIASNDVTDPVTANDRFCALAAHAGTARIVCLGRLGGFTPPKCGRIVMIPESALTSRIRDVVDDPDGELQAQAFACGRTADCPTRHTHQNEAPELTGQEARVFALLLDGESNKAIARRLGLSEKTVKNYVTRIFLKVGVTSRAAAIATMRIR
ncbi:response regulator transcription factor [Epidermidibacterium keratini]